MNDEFHNDLVGTAPPEGFSRYRLISGPDDGAFCARVSEALDLGWELHGSPSVACTPDGSLRVGQALMWPAPSQRSNASGPER